MQSGGGASVFIQSYDFQGSKEGKGMCSKAASILPREGDKGMRATMNRCDRLRWDAVNVELAILHLFGNVDKNGRGILEDDVTVDGGHHRINH